MEPEDPFSAPIDPSSDRTVILPRPGGKGQAVAPRSTAKPRFLSNPVKPTDRQGLNPLEVAASSLLEMLGRLRGLAEHPDPNGLRDKVSSEIKRFEVRAERSGVDRDTLYWARYVLCTALDEAVLATPWGHDSIWSTQGLMISFHKEAWGGEKFFQLLNRLMQNPAGNLHLIELMYICLTLGFEGRYRRQPNGAAQLLTLRQEVYRIIRNQRGDFERELSLHWTGTDVKQNPLIQYVPLWVLGAVAGLLLLFTYLGFNLSLNADSDPVFEALYSVGRGVEPLVRPEPTSAPGVEFEPEGVTLTGLLKPEIEAQQLAVTEDQYQALVSLRGDGLFQSGRVQVANRYKPLLERIAWALDQLEGKILVIGHTDNLPIRSLRYPSNWHLSRARAEAVATFLSRQLAANGKRLHSEGRGDTEPVVANDSPQNRARNRRVEIKLIKHSTVP